MRKTTKVQKAVKATKKTTKTTYNAVAKNVYFNGHSYRARITVDGTCNSRNFTSKTAAIRWRNEVRRAIA